MDYGRSPSLDKATVSLAVLGLSLLANCGYQYGTKDTAVDVCVTGLSDKVRSVAQYDEDGNVVGYKTEHKWLVHTDDGTYGNSSAWLSGKFDSSELKGAIKEGYRYDIDYYGWDIGFDWYYRNILSVEGKGLCLEGSVVE